MEGMSESNYRRMSDNESKYLIEMDNRSVMNMFNTNLERELPNLVLDESTGSYIPPEIPRRITNPFNTERSESDIEYANAVTDTNPYGENEEIEETNIKRCPLKCPLNCVIS
tara:strand:- start:28158 stop:28493 length:336 start_codon:yes stop_codon:yes gene_type:complete